MSNNVKKSLKERAREFSVQLPLMEGREKGETSELLATVCTITDYGFLPNEAGEPYAVFTVKEIKDKFFFGGSVLTARLTELEADGYHDVIVEEGLPVLMTNAKSKKSNRAYVNVEFYPEG